MAFLRRRLGSRVPVDAAVRLLDVRARAEGLPPPAVLAGEWFGSRAVIAPSITVTPVPAAEAFAVPARQPVSVAGDAPPGVIGGGWFGYLGYDLTDPSGRSGALPAAVWGWADHVLRLDAEGTWWFETLTGSAELAADYERMLSGAGPAARWRPVRLRRSPQGAYEAAVKECVHAIEAGELYQTNICTRFDTGFAGRLAAVFAEGVRRMRPRRAAYLAGDWGAVASFSPELFLARQGDRVRTRPIKGTRPRRGPRDDHLAHELRASAKEVAENVMITDLMRNDLGRVCATGSVTVPELLAVRPAPGVWHLESTVSGRVLGDDDALLAATFPPGSVTGAPKLRALDLIAELEPHPRGVYTGAIGLASPLAGLELNVAIRTLQQHRDLLWLGVGGGITADSEPGAEWQECLHKAAAIADLLGSP